MSVRKDNMPSRGQVAKYWRNKGLNSCGQIVYYDGISLDIIPIIVDFEFPSCFCCNGGIDITDNPKFHTHEGTKYAHRIWDYPKVNLTRCHIIPDSLGGTCDADNLFLMCDKCHVESPDCSQPGYFFAYIYKIRKDFIEGKPFKERYNELKDLAEIVVSNPELSNSDCDELKWGSQGGLVANSTRDSMLINSWIRDNTIDITSLLSGEYEDDFIQFLKLQHRYGRTG